MQEEDKNKMSKVTSMTPGGAIDLDARDPNNLNEHLQVIFASIGALADQLSVFISQHASAVGMI